MNRTRANCLVSLRADGGHSSVLLEAALLSGFRISQVRSSPTAWARMYKWVLLILPIGLLAQDLPNAPSYSTHQPLKARAATSSKANAIPEAAIASPPKKQGFRWGHATGETLLVLGVQHAANLGMDKWARQTIQKPDFFGRWFHAVENVRWTVWNDNDPFLDNYIAHPMIGAVYGWIQVQNDPKYKDVPLENSRRYWKSRLRAMAWAAAWSTQWEIGPLSEASIQNIGGFPYYSNESKGMTNGTGMVDFVMTPVAGTVWMVGEDALDKYVSSRLRRVSKNRLWLLGVSILTPTRGAANLVRWKAPWYRDYETRPGMLVQLESAVGEP
ncbi:MAG TPA: hypothetical protein VN577_22055 [Terriglobales bacterium]|nr:hypothetical protein [Terriglobales bacterium]